MEKDIEELKEKMQGFAKKYNCVLEADTYVVGRDLEGKIVNPRVEIIIRS